MDGVGLITVVKHMGLPFVMPPFTPPLLFVFVYTFPFSMRKASFASLPRIFAKSIPAPKSTPFTPGTENIMCAITLSRLSK